MAGVHYVNVRLPDWFSLPVVFLRLPGFSAVEGVGQVAEDADGEEPVYKDDYQHKHSEPQPKPVDLTGVVAFPGSPLGGQTVLDLVRRMQFSSFEFLTFFNGFILSYVSFFSIHILRFYFYYLTLPILLVFSLTHKKSAPRLPQGARFFKNPFRRGLPTLRVPA